MKHSSTILFVTQQSLAGQDLLIIEASRSHLGIPHSVGLLWTSDQPDALLFQIFLERLRGASVSVTGYPGRDLIWEPPQYKLSRVNAVQCNFAFSTFNYERSALDLFFQ